MTQIILVAIGGMLGSVLRFIISMNISSSLTLPFSPVVVVNLVGSFLVGVLLGIGKERLGDTLYFFIIPGLLGGFTTYSAFSGEILVMFKQELYFSVFSYLGITLIGGLLLAACSYYFVSMIFK